MWEIDNATPYAAAYTWVRDRDGADCWVVAVRATFLIQPDGSTTLADEQSEVCLAPKYLGEPGHSSLIYDSDLIHTKPTTDITLLGHAYAPEGRPARQVDVTLTIGSVTKTLRVFGDRYWFDASPGLRISDPQPFEKMPITYERAFGGSDLTSSDPSKRSWDTRNPVGCGFAVEEKHLASQPVPNVEDPRALLSSWRQRPAPAGFGPIAPHWSPRSHWSGTYDERWEKERQPLVPDDFDDRFYLASPPDQQPATHLRGEETIELINLTPGQYLRFQLPRIVLGFETYFYNGDVIRHRPTLHNVILEPDVPRVILVWNTVLQCHSKALKLDRTRVVAKEQIRRVIP